MIDLFFKLTENFQTSLANKRRSFPTGNEFFVRHANSKCEKSISSQQMEQNTIQSTSIKTKYIMQFDY